MLSLEDTFKFVEQIPVWEDVSVGWTSGMVGCWVGEEINIGNMLTWSTNTR